MNFARDLLFAQAYLQQSALLMKQAVLTVLQQYCTHIKEIVLLTDDGSENVLLANLQVQNITLQHLIAQKDIAFSNSMVEAANKRLKYQWLYRMNVIAHKDLQTIIDKAILMKTTDLTMPCMGLALLRYYKTKPLKQ